MTTPIGMNSSSNMSESLADLRISKIKQKITSPGTLVEIITKFNLYPDDRKSDPMASIAKDMASKIRLNLVSSTVANPAATQKVSVDQLSAIAFMLSFDYSDPQTAQQVTNELVTRFLDEDLKERHEQAEATSEFIGKQIAIMETQMVEQEKKIAEFQSEHGISKPEVLMFNQQAAANTSVNLQSLESQLTSNLGTQGSLRAQLAVVEPYSRVLADGQVLTTPATQLKALEAQYTTLTAQYGERHPDVVKVKRQIEALRSQAYKGDGGQDTGALKAQIEDVKTNLEAAESTLGEDHPDVAALKRQLKKLENELKAGGETTSDNGIKQDADNPAYLSLVAQLRATQEQYKALSAQREALVAQQTKYQEAVNQNPTLEQQMAALARDYDNAQLRYRELKAKKMAADMDQQMIQDRKGQRLVVINPPELPLKTQPSRLLIILAGFIMAFVGGLGMVIIVQTTNQSVMGPHHLAALVGVPPLVVIPHIYTDREKEKDPTRLISVQSVTAVCVLLVIAFILFGLVLLPLGMLWSFLTNLAGF
ncbi:MAG: hypothetical protein WAO98_06810 [Alphaproteobacteria bacterium]